MIAKTKSLLVLFVLLLSFSACEKEGFHSVSLTQLLNAPEKYDGMTLQTSGYLDLNINLFLYLTSEHAEGGDTSSGILMSDTDAGEISQSDCLSLFVTVTGRFTSLKSQPHVYLLGNISQIYATEEGRDCFKN